MEGRLWVALESVEPGRPGLEMDGGEAVSYGGGMRNLVNDFIAGAV